MAYAMQNDSHGTRGTKPTPFNSMADIVDAVRRSLEAAGATIHEGT